MYSLEEGSATAGVLEFENDYFAIDQAIAKMMRTAGDVVLSVLASKKQVSSIMITELAANYKTDNAKLIKVIFHCTEQSSEVMQSTESLPFCEALNIILNAIS